MLAKTKSWSRFREQARAEAALAPGEAWIGIVYDADFVRIRIQHGAAELPVVPAVARVAGRTGIGDQHAADTFDHLAVRVPVQHDVGIRLGEPVQPGTVRMHIVPAWLPRR